MIMAWICYLFWLKEYFSFSFIPGSMNTLADSVSRLDDVCHWPEFQAWLSNSPTSRDLRPHMSALSLALLRSKGWAATGPRSSQLPASCLCSRFQVYLYESNAFIPFVYIMASQPLPAAGSTLNRYAAFLARSLSASSIPAYLNAVRILHLEHGLTDPTKNNFHLANTLRGIKRAKGLTVSQKKPITLQILLALKN